METYRVLIAALAVVAVLPASASEEGEAKLEGQKLFEPYGCTNCRS